MKRFRLQNNVPDVYVKQSRDFQLMCNLFDLMNNGVKFDIDTITSSSDTLLCRESMLSYLQHKLGLHMKREVTDDTLRTILKCFPYIVNNKGSKKGVIECICLFLNIIYADCEHTIEIDNKDENRSPSGSYIVSISMEENLLRDLDILDNLLRYVIPTGYIIRYNLEFSAKEFTTDIAGSDSVDITFVNDYFGSKVRNEVTDREDNVPGVIGTVGATTIRITNSGGYKPAAGQTAEQTLFTEEYISDSISDLEET